MNTGMRYTFGRSKLQTDTNSFITVWDTTKVGVTNSNQIMLPITNNNSDLNATIYWGDGTSNSLTSFLNPAEFTHTYSIPGVYTVKISGSFQDCWGFANSGDKLKILKVLQWGDQSMADSRTNGFFMYGCSNLVLDNVVDVLQGVGNVRWFQNCTSLVKINNVNNWPLFINGTPGGSFGLASIFNNTPNLILEIKDWNIGRVSRTEGLVDFITGGGFIPNSFYDDLLIHTANDPGLLSGKNFDAGSSKYTLGSAAETARNQLINVNGWTINDGGGI